MNRRVLLIIPIILLMGVGAAPTLEASPKIEATAQGVKVQALEFQGTALRASYDEAKELLVLEGSSDFPATLIWTRKGQIEQFRAAKIMYSLKTGALRAESVSVLAGERHANAAASATDEGGKSDGEPKSPDEPAWKKEFREKYGLKEGEHVKRIAPPYPDCRAEYFRDLIREAYKRNKLVPPDDEVNRAMSDHFTKFAWKDGWLVDRLMEQTTPVKPDDGVTLRQLIHMTTGFGQARTEGDADLLDQKVTGDFVVRAGADPAKVATALEKILRKECDLPVSLAVQEVEREVFVLEGKYEAKPLDGRKKNEIEVYAKHLLDRKTGGGGTDTFDRLVVHLEQFVRLPVRAGKIEGLPKEVSWHFNVRSPMVKDPTRHIDTYAEDTNAVMVLDNIASQTGLTVKTENQKVRVLVVERAKPDK